MNNKEIAMRSRILHTLTFALLLALVPTANALPLVNGSFETGDLNGWTGSGNVGVVSNNTNDCCVASDGTKFVDFNGGDATPNGIISQSFSASIGAQYVLGFDFAKGGTGTGEASLLVEVEGVASLVSETVASSIGGLPGSYDSFLYGFTADSAAITLRFTDSSAGTASYDALLDNVSVSAVPVPVPATVWLIGFAILGARVMGRRKKKT